MSGSPVVPDVPGLPPRNETRKCQLCRCEFPATLEFFCHGKTDPSGLSIECRECVNASRKRRSLRKQNAKRNQLNQALDHAITEAAELSRAGKRGTVPHLVELIQSLSEVFGGAPGIAAHVGATYRAAKPGSMVRQRILGQVVAMVTAGTEQNLVRKPESAMNDDELAAEIQSLVKSAVDRGLVIEGKVAPAIEQEVPDGDEAS